MDMTRPRSGRQTQRMHIIIASDACTPDLTSAIGWLNRRKISWTPKAASNAIINRSMMLEAFGGQ
jgi:hypothetical protein